MYGVLYLVPANLLKHSPAMPLKTHVAAPGSTNSERLAASPALKGVVTMGAVCVERGRSTWPITMLNRTHTNRHKIKEKSPYTLA